MLVKYKKKLEATDKLSEDKQVIIILNTQREIDQLYAMLNFVPIISALDTAEGAENWRALKGFLQPHNYSFWHNRLSNRCSTKDNL